MEVKHPKREFVFEKETLPDPNPAMTAGEVASFYSNAHPELITSLVGKPKLVGDKVVIEFTPNAGTKG